MLATLSREVFSGADWVFERKLDGERCLAFRFGDRVRLLSRNRKPLNDTYPELVEALARQRSDDFVADGEVVAFEDGMTSFARLQQRMQVRDARQARASNVRVFYYVFDLPYLAGNDLTRLRLLDRKALLKGVFSFSDPLRDSEHRERDGESFHRQACADGWEGLIAKRVDSAYVQVRSRDWLKFKCVNEQEFVIVGFTDPQGSRQEFGALLVAYYAGHELAYAGKVGTGYNDRILREVGARLRSLERGEPTLSAPDLPRRSVHWVSPELVAQIGYTEMTRDGRLRHPRFLGLREDKDPREVVLERPS
jgi:bifunctional non-homologous end joining protein LigD